MTAAARSGQRTARAAEVTELHDAVLELAGLTERILGVLECQMGMQAPSATPAWPALTFIPGRRAGEAR